MEEDISLKQKQALPLDVKIEMTKRRIEEWHNYWGGKTYISFSGGKDSTVLLHLVRSLYPDTPAVFSDTGLEFPEIREFVKTFDNVEWVRPKKSFYKVLQEYGYPVVSKDVAGKIELLRGKNRANAERRFLEGYNQKGEYDERHKLPKKWEFLIDAPFDISDKCCDIIKKEPLGKYSRETGRKPFIGTMAVDSYIRRVAYYRNECNTYTKGNEHSNPMSFWTVNDIWDYISQYNLEYCKIYNMGYSNTGCMFCMFGAHLDKFPGRFIQMKATHPDLWEYCVYQLNLKEPLEYLNIPYDFE